LDKWHANICHSSSFSLIIDGFISLSPDSRER